VYLRETLSTRCYAVAHDRLLVLGVKFLLLLDSWRALAKCVLLRHWQHPSQCHTHKFNYPVTN